MSQSTNDVYPTAIKAGLQTALTRLRAAMRDLAAEFAVKSTEFSDVLKVGRTQLQDAVPMTLGQEFATFALMIDEDSQRLGEAATLISRDQSGRNGDRDRSQRAPRVRVAGARHLAAITGIER